MNNDNVDKLAGTVDDILNYILDGLAYVNDNASNILLNVVILIVIGIVFNFIVYRIVKKVRHKKLYQTRKYNRRL